MYLDIYLRSRPQDGTLVYKAFSFLYLKIIHSFCAAGSGIRIYSVVSVQLFLTPIFRPPWVSRLKKGKKVL